MKKLKLRGRSTSTLVAVVFAFATIAASTCEAKEARSTPGVTDAAAVPLLTGTVLGPAGEPLAGIAISATREGSPVTTSVYSDQRGRYFFPPLNSTGAYRVTAQAAGYEMAVSASDIRKGVQRADFRLKAAANPLLQLSAWEQLKLLPEETREQRRAKAILVRRCTGCHQSSRLFARKFDERGWLAVINTMWVSDPDRLAADAPLKAELARYLNDTIGPGAAPLRVTEFARAAGDSALPVYYVYRIPDVRGRYADISDDWSDGLPIASGTGVKLHDATVDFDGNVWFSSPIPLPGRTVGKLDGVTGKATSIGFPGDVPGTTGFSHGLITARDGSLWFTVALGNNLGVAHLGYINPRTGEQQIYRVPDGYPNVGGFLDEDGLGNIWTSAGKFTSAGATADDGVLKFDRKSKQFLPPIKSLHTGFTYGVAGDAEGNGWWAQIFLDKVYSVDARSGKVSEIQLPFTWGNANFLQPGDMDPQEFVDLGRGGGLSLGAVPTGVQMPRRIKADPHGDDLWVANHGGNSVLRVNTKSRDTVYYPAPAPGMAPYKTGVDRLHRVWVGLQNADDVARLDPDTGKWTIYPLPLKGVSARGLSVVEREGGTEVIIPANDSNRVVRMIVRTEADVAALRSKYYGEP